MKSIQNQYRDLKEGRMSQANFMRNLRMTMPQYVTNVTSFNDAVKILKNKSILTESAPGREAEIQQKYLNDVISCMGNGDSYAQAISKVAAANEIDEDTLANMVPEQSVGNEAYAKMYEDKDEEVKTDEEEEILAMLNKIEQEKAGEEAIMSQYDPIEEEQLNEYEHTYRKIDGVCYKIDDEGNKTRVSDYYCRYGEGLNEGKGKELHPNQIHPQELRMGIKVELEHTDDLDKAKKIALDHLAENPFYYTALKLSGIESPSVFTAKPPVKKGKKKESIQLIDLANQMKKVKMPKAEEKKKLKESNTDERMMFQDLPADPEKYQIKKDMKGKIVQATNDEGNVFSMNDEAIAIDNGEKIKIAGFKEEQGKVKALFNKGMFFSSIDIDGLKPINKGFRPGVNLGASFEKFKKSLEEVVRETINEYYFDGRDNLIDDIAAEKN